MLRHGIRKLSSKWRRADYTPILKAAVAFSVAAVGASYQQKCTFCDAAPLATKPKIFDEVPAPIVVESSLLSTLNRGAAAVIETMQEVVRYVNKFLVYTHRIILYAILGMPVVAVASTAYVMGGVPAAIEDIVWDCCLWAVHQLGPSFIKLAQWASTRPDLYPPALIKRLESLQDDVKVHYSRHTVEHTITQAFGENWKDYIELEDEPLGAGCVAQVFRGTLKEGKDKKPVVVKLIHPHVEKLIKTDMELLSIFATFLDQFPTLKLLAIGDTCREWVNSMNLQLDLEVEAKNLQDFAAKFKDDTWIGFPVPIEGFVSHNVLVETFMEGSSIVNYMKMKSQEAGDKIEQLKLKLSDLGCRAIIKMVFFDNLIHGDMHPGNILVQMGPKGEPKMIFLDAGIVYRSKTEEAYKALVDICFAFMRHDGYQAGRLMIDRSHEADKESADAFCSGVQKIIDDAEEESYFEHIGDYVARICNLAREHSVRLDPGYFQVAMALKVMEGVALSLNADLELISKCTPLVVKARALRAVGIKKFPPPGED